MNRFPLKTLLATILTLLISQAAFAAEEKKDEPKTLTGASESMLSNTCAACHGTFGASKGPSIPTLAGMSATYLVETMNGYKSGDIPSTIMGRLAKGYSEDEIKLMGEFFSKQKFVAATGQTFDSAKAKKGAELHETYCDQCHSESGTVAEDDSGFLKGQWKSYLSAQLMDFKNNDRIANKKMALQLEKLHKDHSQEGIEALIEYYNSDK